ncbi:MAG: SARP family transcriptional regulator, partial [Paracoccaceae bacterium]
MKVELRLGGPLAVLGPDGIDLTPQGSRRVLGLVALIATAPEMRRRRKDLQALLWSDRTPDQQSASLRQALSDLRRALGPFKGVLLADRQSIGFDPVEVVVATTGPDSRPFLDGLEVPDPA